MSGRADRPRRELCAWGVLALIVASAAACPGAIDDPSRFLASRSGVAEACAGSSATELFAARCATAGCHGAQTPASGLDLQTPGLEQRLLGGTSHCGGRPLVDAETLSRSVFLEKISGKPTCGGRMPPTGSSLSAFELSCVRAWLEELIAGPAGEAGGEGDASAASPNTTDAGAGGDA